MPFADELIGLPTVAALTEAISAAAPEARLSNLERSPDLLAPLSLRERSDLLRDALLADLPEDYVSFAAVIRTAQHGEATFEGWLIWPVTSAVALKAVADGAPAAFDDALSLLAELTSRLTSEFAIRTLLDHDLPRALRIIETWAASNDEHVRRLASEGTRPFLPWARRVSGILADPTSTLPILDALYRDDSEYVRRSVANHLNDLARQHPDLVVQTAASWLADPDLNTPRLVRHGLRTLVKRGHPGALGLLGFSASTDLEVVGPTTDVSSLAFGGTIAFAGSIRNRGPASVALAVDYVVHHTKSNGAQTTKTFKLTTTTLAPGESIGLSKGHSFRELTTRRYYAGAHAIELQVNGVRYGRAEFALLAPDAPAPSADPVSR